LKFDTIAKEGLFSKQSRSQGLFILESLQWFIHHRDTEDTENAQRKAFKPLCPLCALCVSVVNYSPSRCKDE
jgi:hypothetical protein